MATGLEQAEAKLFPNYVTDDMLLNADKDASNWLLYGRDYQTTRYSPLATVNKGNIKNLKAAWNLSFGVLDGQDSQAVVVNLQRIERDQGLRIIDFLSGTVYALGGDIQRIGTDIFLCVPDTVEVDGAISDYYHDDQQ